MSFLSGHTKKVSVYGRKAEVRVINRHSTFTSLQNDENDPFGFLNTHSRKPTTTYRRTRPSVLPSQLLSESTGSDEDNNDDTLHSQPAADQSAAYDTANSSLSFHSACSSTKSSNTTKPSVSKSISKEGQRKALSSQTLNSKEQAELESQTSVRPAKSAIRSLQNDAAIITTPKARRGSSKRVAAESPQTVRKPLRSKVSTPASSSAASLPNESTPPQNQPTGRAPRRAAQAARMAIEDYDFTDRDMTPRRPVPTKSYFVEKARQLAELAIEEEQEQGQIKPPASASQQTSGTQGRKSTASSDRSHARKSMAARPRHTSALGSNRTTSIAISDSSLSSVNGMSDSSFEDGGSSQSSFSLIIPNYDDLCDPPPQKSAAAKTKAKQNKRVTRRIAADSDEDEDADKATEGSDDENEQDPATKLAAQVADLAVADTDEVSASESHLSDLLASVSQTKPNSFADVIRQLRTAAGSSRTSAPRRRLEKIGEASYSEVFKIFKTSQSTYSTKDEKQEALVLKIIPISGPNSTDDGDDIPYTSPAADVEREIRLMQLIGREFSATDPFVSLRAAHVVKGAYPAALLQAWDRWDAKRRTKTGEGAENIRPHVLGHQQVYALIVMSDGGKDLESLKVKSWLQAASIFWQVVAGLSEMESRYEFEHRDLHWGNILVQTVTQDLAAPLVTQTTRRRSAARSKATGSDESAVPSWLLNPSTSGVKATIIDFTLSRASTSPITKGRSRKPEVLYYPFDDETLFEGAGDPQFDVYREMRTLTKGDWQNFNPATNMLWLRYLAHKLIDVKCKSCRPPKSADVEVQWEMQAYSSLHNATARLDAAAQKLSDEAAASSSGGKKTAPVAGRKSLHPRARKSVLPPAASGVRKARSTMAVTPLLHQVEEDAVTVRSAVELMSLFSH
ncbi:related to ALK1 - protein kinase [Ustilago trichophora]|uniref:non-specific serine/threonine protein kinase n=1 Tax=Ustilago trichophora TaxID=86804 RepID=A0A5C3DQU3_9BASI|nr:related to ALK1 - protein kinase [Ustilago trichophora]